MGETRMGTSSETETDAKRSYQDAKVSVSRRLRQKNTNESIK